MKHVPSILLHLALVTLCQVLTRVSFHRDQLRNLTEAIYDVNTVQITSIVASVSMLLCRRPLQEY